MRWKAGGTYIAKPREPTWIIQNMGHQKECWRTRSLTMSYPCGGLASGANTESCSEARPNKVVAASVAASGEAAVGKECLGRTSAGTHGEVHDCAGCVGGAARAQRVVLREKVVVHTKTIMASIFLPMSLPPAAQPNTACLPSNQAMSGLRAPAAPQRHLLPDRGGGGAWTACVSPDAWGKPARPSGASTTCISAEPPKTPGYTSRNPKWALQVWRPAPGWGPTPRDPGGTENATSVLPDGFAGAFLWLGFGVA